MLSINILDGNTRCEGWVFIEESYKVALIRCCNGIRRNIYFIIIYFKKNF